MSSEVYLTYMSGFHEEAGRRISGAKALQLLRLPPWLKPGVYPLSRSEPGVYPLSRPEPGVYPLFGFLRRGCYGCAHSYDYKY